MHTIAGLGPSFIKIAQVFAGRADLLPEPYLSAVSTLVDRVPPVEAQAVEAAIVAAYGQPVHAIFEEWDPTPIAAASLGQVHRARYKSRDVAVKVLRPGVEALVAADVRAARTILTAAGRLFTNPHIPGLRALLDEFARRIGEEMDFYQEASYTTEIRRNFVGNPHVAIPAVVEELTRRTVLVLEYMPGTRIDALASLVDTGRIDPRRLVQSVMELYVQMMLVDGLFHADPHPGNLLVQEDGTIVVLDFGLVLRIPRETRLTMVRTVFAAIQRDVNAVVDGFYALGVTTPGVDREVATRLVQTLLEVAHRRTTTQERLELMQSMQAELLADQVMTTLYDFPVVLPPDLFYFARTAALIEGLGIRYDPRFNVLECVTPIALRMRRRILGSLGVAPEIPALSDIVAVFRHALHDAGGIMRRAGREMFGLAAEVLTALASRGPRVRGNGEGGGV